MQKPAFYRQTAAVWLCLAVGMLLVSCTGTPSTPSEAARPPITPLADVLPAPCAAQYSALLDLADLARRYGPSAGLFLDPLGDMFDQLDRCLAAAGNGGRPPSAEAARTALAVQTASGAAARR